MHGAKLLWRYPARHALGPIINSLGFDLNRIFNELPIVALILTLTEAGALLLEALARSNDQQLAGAIIFLLTASSRWSSRVRCHVRTARPPPARCANVRSRPLTSIIRRR